MTLSKKSINNFANQYNTAVNTKSLSFSVEATMVNLEILRLFQEAGLIKNYYFEPFDPVHSEELKTKLNPFVTLEHKWLDNKMHFFDFKEFGSLLSSKVPYVRDTFLPETYRIWQEKYKYTEDYTKLGVVDSLHQVDLKDYTYKEFLTELHDMLKNLVASNNLKTGDVCSVLNHSESVKITINNLKGLMINTENIGLEDSWDAFSKVIKKLYSNSLRSSFGQTPYYIIFNELHIIKLEEYINYINSYAPLLTNVHKSRISMPLLIPDDNWNLTKIFYDHQRIVVFPKYENSIPGIRKLFSCGGTQVWRYVSYNYLRQLCNSEGFNTFYLISTSNGLTLTTLDWVLSNQGGLLILKIDT